MEHVVVFVCMYIKEVANNVMLQLYIYDMIFIP
jgi:hypothetical protein